MCAVEASVRCGSVNVEGVRCVRGRGALCAWRGGALCVEGVRCVRVRCVCVGCEEGCALCVNVEGVWLG